MISRRSATLNRLVGTLAIAAIAALGVAAPGNASDLESPLERSVKAAFLYKFAGYVEWPSGTFARDDAPITIGVVGDDDLASELKRLTAGRTSGGRRVTVTRLHAFDPLNGVHILFLGNGESARLHPLIRATAAKPVLVVTESEGALALGSTINLVDSDERIRFEVDLTSASRRGLTLSSRLLAVAQSVVTGNP